MQALLLFLVSGVMLSVAQDPNLANVIDPMGDIKPIPSYYTPVAQDDRADVSMNSDDDDGRTGDNSAGSTVASHKRDVNGNLVSVAAKSEASLHRFVVDRGQLIKSADRSDECTYTYLLPVTLQEDSRVCVMSRTQVTSRSDSRQSSSCAGEERLTDLYRQVLAAKSQVDSARNEIVREKHRPSKAMHALERDVNYLKQETRIANDRVTQLHTQFMHEVVNDRDSRVEVIGLENKLLNQTIKLYALREQHTRLQYEHTALQGDVVTLSQQLEELRRIVDGLSNRPEPQPSPCAKINDKPTSTTTATPGDPLMEIETRAFASDQPQSGTHSVHVIPNKRRRTGRAGSFRDCSEVQRAGHTESGMYKLRLPNEPKRIRVWCDLDQDPGGWTVIQRRSGDGVNFLRNMANYKRGFGKLRGDFWLGLDNIHKLTNQTQVTYKLHVDLEDWQGRKTFVEYRSFRVDSEVDGYKLRIAHYSGNAGDSLTWHNNMKFTTTDVDHDQFPRNCANLHRGGWWYNACAHSNLNGIYYRNGHYGGRYQDGIYWSEWRGESYSLKSVSMKLRPIE